MNSSLHLLYIIVYLAGFISMMVPSDYARKDNTQNCIKVHLLWIRTEQICGRWTATLTRFLIVCSSDRLRTDWFGPHTRASTLLTSVIGWVTWYLAGWLAVRLPVTIRNCHKGLAVQCIYYAMPSGFRVPSRHIGCGICTVHCLTYFLWFALKISQWCLGNIL